MSLPARVFSAEPRSCLKTRENTSVLLSDGSICTRLAPYSSAPATRKGKLDVLMKRQVTTDRLFQHERATPSKERCETWFQSLGPYPLQGNGKV